MKSQFFKRTLTAAAVAAAMGLSATAVAQSTTGTVNGQVVTSSDAAVTGATVTIRNVDTGFTRTVQVESDGSYRFPQLPTGRYTVTANANGYEPNQTQEFVISAGGSREITVPLSSGIETIDVSGTSISMVDTRASGTSLNIGEAQIDRIPVPRNATAVALLAPSTTAGDGRFGNLASFGGSSVAENAVYINGLNVTNFRTGTGFSDVPFEFYKEFEVKTGGYSAEFGRSTGGVINAITKSGTNEFEFGANVYYQPESLREQSPNTRVSTGEVYVRNELDERSEMEGNIYASGPIIKDTLFFYAIYNPRDLSATYTSGSGEKYQTYEDSADDAFYGGKLDWQITSNHLVELLAFSDSSTLSTDEYKFDANGDQYYNQTAFQESGGDNWSVKYTGYLTDDLTVSALYGENKYNLSSSSTVQEDCTLVIDTRGSAPMGVYPGCMGTNGYRTEQGEDTREAMRIDFEWYLGDHLLRFGYDTETNTSNALEGYSGPDGKIAYLNDATEGGELANGATLPDIDAYVEERVRTVEGSFETENQAFYVEDIWSITDNLTATIGLRYDSFENKNGNGETFVKVDNMYAPRLGLSYDINGDGQSKVFANVGRYYLPVASNTNVRMSGNEYDVTQYFVLEGTSVDQYNGNDYLTYTKGDQIGPDRVNASGAVPNTKEFVDQDIDPMYQDEYIIGYESAFAENWSWGVRGIRRELNGAIDDMSVEGYLDDTYGCHGNSSYVLGNPGEVATIFADTDCNADTALEKIDIDLAEIGFPEGKRSYNAVELTLAKAWDGKWSLNASYTWAQSYGNTEGLVKSDIAQDDAGITQDFDFAELMDGAYGYLPNDRRHTFKAYGAYALTENFRLGANFTLSSGRPLNAFGIGHPNGVPSYGDTFYVCTANCTEDNCVEPGYKQISRGTYGRTDWTPTLDLNATYVTEWAGTEVEFRADVYNVLNSSAVQRRNEFAEENVPGDANEYFMAPTAYQTPRYVQLSAGIKF